jgi:hypothetical protein
VKFRQGGKIVEIKIDLSKFVNNQEEIDMLKNVLRCEDKEELKKEMTGITKAAINEYLDMLLGRNLPTRAREIKERRLFHLLKHYFIGRIPTEAEISSLFQMTDRSSRTLLRNVRTKFKFELKEEIENTIKTILLSVKTRGNKYIAVIKNDNLLEELKHTVAEKAPHLDQIKRVPNSAGVYFISEDTFDILCSHYGIDLDEVEAASSSK